MSCRAHLGGGLATLRLPVRGSLAGRSGKQREKAGIFLPRSATVPRMMKPKTKKSRELRTCGLRLMLEPSIYAAAKKAADAEQRSVSAWARRLILSALEAKR